MEFLLFLVWEFLIGFSAYCLISALLAGSSTQPFKDDLDGTFVSAVLALKLFIGCAIPQWLAFSIGSSSIVLFFIAIVLATSSGTLLWFRKAKNLTITYDNVKTVLSPSSHFETSKEDASVKWVSILGLLLLTPLIATSFMPVIETDSVHHSNALWGLADGRMSPLDFPNHYVAFWESGYIPGMIIADTQQYFSFISLQAVILVGLVSYTLARTLNLSPLHASLFGLTALLAGHLWGYAPTGVATIKNDMIYAAGILATITGLLKVTNHSTLHCPGIVLFAIGSAFASSKFSGPPMIVLISLTACAFWWRLIFTDYRRFLWAIGAILIAIILSSGIYFIANWVRFENPFYPVELSVGPLHFPGSINLDGTSILDHAGQMETWRYFFGWGTNYDIHASRWPYLEVGLLFPAIFALGFLSFILYLRDFFAPLPDQEKDNWLSKNVIFLAVVAVISWFLFIRSFWTAGATPDDFFYLRTQASLRYAIAQSQLLLLLAVVSATFILRGKRWLSLAFLGAVLIDRVVTVYAATGTIKYASVFQSNTPFWQTAWLWLGLAILLGALVVVFRQKQIIRLAPATTISMGFLIVSGFFVPATYRANTDYENWPANVVDEFAPSEDIGEVYGLAGGSGVPLRPNAFAASGSRNQLTFKDVVTVDNLRTIPISQKPQYLVAVCNRTLKFIETNLRELERQTLKAGFSLVKYNECSALFTKFSARAFKSSDASGTRPLYSALEDVCVFKRASCKKEVLENGHIFATSEPAGLWEMTANGVQRIELVDPQIKIPLQAVSEQDDRSVTSMSLQNGVWIIDEAKLQEKLEQARDYAFPEMAVTNPADRKWFISSPDEIIVDVVPDISGQSVIRITSINDMPWLAIGIRPKDLTSRKGVFYGRVRSNTGEELLLSMESFDFENGVRVSPPARQYFSKEGVASGWSVYEFGVDIDEDYSALAIVGLNAGQIIDVEAFKFSAVEELSLKQLNALNYN